MRLYKDYCRGPFLMPSKQEASQWGSWVHGGFAKLGGTPFGSPNNKDDSIWGYIGVPIFWETTKCCFQVSLLCAWP